MCRVIIETRKERGRERERRIEGERRKGMRTNDDEEKKVVLFFH